VLVFPFLTCEAADVILTGTVSTPCGSRRTSSSAFQSLSRRITEYNTGVRKRPNRFRPKALQSMAVPTVRRLSVPGRVASGDRSYHPVQRGDQTVGLRRPGSVG